MITGRDLIIYILENGLENEPMIKNGKIVGLMTTDEAAVKFDVGKATIDIWIRDGLIDSETVYYNKYVPINATDPRIGLRDRYMNLIKRHEGSIK